MDSKVKATQSTVSNRKQKKATNAKQDKISNETIKVVQRQISNPQHAAVGGLVQAPFPNDSTHVRMSRPPNNRLEGHCI